MMNEREIPTYIKEVYQNRHQSAVDRMQKNRSVVYAKYPAMKELDQQLKLASLNHMT